MIALLFAVALSLPAIQTPAPVVPPPKPDPGKVAWFDKSLSVALAQANLQNRLTLVFFRADWNGDGQKMNDETFSNEQVAAALKDVVCVSVDYDKQRELADRYAVKDLPVVLWINPDSSVRERVNKYQTRDVFLANAARIKADIGTINELRRKVAEKGDDLELRFELYRRLKDAGSFHDAEEQKAAIVKLDPQKTSRGSRHFRFAEITSAIEKHWALTGALDMQKVGELQTFTEAESDPDLVWEGWMRLSNTYDYFAKQAQSAGKADEARAHRVTRRQYLSNAFRGIPPDLFREWAITSSSSFWDQKDELSSGDKEFLLALTDRFLQTFDKEGLAHDMRARALFLNGKRDEAIAAARKATELNPSNRLFQERLKELGGS